MDKVVRIVLLKKPKTPVLYTSLAAISSFANIDGPVTFLVYDLECYFFNNIYVGV